MAHGPRICACCGAEDGIEEHHLYPKSDGCPDDLTSYLCHVCHGRTHGMQSRMNMSVAVKAGLERARARGVKLGPPPSQHNNLRDWVRLHGMGAARAGVQEGAKRRAEIWRSTIKALVADGLGNCAIARALNQRGEPSVRGGTWNATGIRVLRARLGVLVALMMVFAGDANAASATASASATIVKSVTNTPGPEAPSHDVAPVKVPEGGEAQIVHYE